jgi:hypothetical protein
MKRSILFLALGLTFVLYSVLFSQIKFDGWLQSSMYAWENYNENQQWDFYEGLQLRVTPQKHSNLYLNTFMRLAYRGDPADWQEKVYNLYLNWGIGQNYRIRTGRQFLYKGVINGTLDAVQLSGQFFKKFQVAAVVGTEATIDRNFKIRHWDNGNVIGGFLAYRLPRQSSLELSYFQKERWSELYWQLLGTTLQGYIGSAWNYYLRFDYNMLSSNYQAMRGRVTYLTNRWSLSAEYNSQRPRIYEDSFFNIFQVKSYNQIRATFTFKVNAYDLGLQLLHTVYNAYDYYILFKDDNDFRLIGSIGHSKYGTLGMIYQNGFGGDNIGYYADLQYYILPDLRFRFFNSYYNYERAATNISEDALSFSAGLGYRWKNILLLEGELQQSSNNLYQNDLRGLMRVTYFFQTAVF